jgi:dihydrofolate reductase
MKPRISIIVALARNFAMGINNTLPWHLPADLKRFKSLTMGHSIIMGRKTFESIGRPLPGRTMVVVSKNSDLKLKNAIVAHSYDEALQACGDDSEIFVAGGAEIFRLALPTASRLYVTELHREFDGDVFFPLLDRSGWHETERQRKQDAASGLSYDFVIYDRRI